MNKRKFLTWKKLLIILLFIAIYLLLPKWSRLSCEFKNWENIVNYNMTCQYDLGDGQKYSSISKCKDVPFDCPEGALCTPIAVSCGIGCRIDKESQEIKCLLVIQ